MILAILIILKTILYINITNIQYNIFTIFIFTTLVSMLILASIEFSKLKNKKIFQIIFYTLFSIIIFIDIMYYSYFQSLPSFTMVSQVTQLTTVGDSIKDIMSIRNLLAIIDLPLTIYYIIKVQKVNEYTKEIAIKVIGIIASLLLLIGIITVKTDKVIALANQEIYSFHVVDIINTYFRSPTITTSGDIKIEDLIEFKQNLNVGELKHNGIGKGKNLIVLQVEALQNFVINLNYNNQEITPNLNKLVQDKSSIYFDDYFQLVGRGNTSDAEFVTQNSLHPSMEDYSYNQYADNTFYGLPWLLRDNGYNAWVFHGYKKEFWNREKAYVNQGFQRFLSEEDYEYNETIGFGISDEEFFDQTIDYLKELDNVDENPFYAFIISLSSHTPFIMDEKYHVIDIKEEHKGTMVANYLQAIHYTDKEIGIFIDKLKQEGLYEDTVIALYGDHFAISNANPEVFPVMDDILGKPYNYDNIMNVPLIIHVPGQEIKETISKIGSQIDFYPTISNIMGYENKKGLMIGQDLINNKEYNFVSPQTTMRRGSFVDKDVIFKISQDGIFKNSKVISRETREELDVEEYRDVYDKVISNINKSEFILKNNILKEMLEKDGNLKQVQINTTNIVRVPEQKTIENYENFTMDELNESYSRGNRIIRIYINGETTDIEELEAWMMEHEDAYLILKSTEEGTEILEKIKDKYPLLRDRYIGEIDDFDKHYLVQRGGYRNIILNIINQNYEDGEILDFLTMHKHYGVIMKEERAKTELSNNLNRMGIKVYIIDELGQLSLYE